MRHIRRLRPIAALIATTLGSANTSLHATEWASVLEALPEDARLDGSVDYREAFQKALNENVALLIPGSDNPEKPLIYGLTTGLKMPDGHALKAGPNAVLKRLPSAGRLIDVGKGGRVIGLTVDGNKLAHWPKYQDLGKHDSILFLRGKCLIEDCRLSNVPGSAIECWTDHNVVRNCVARNCGYIDVKFNADYYQGKWDKWSGDGFYMRGHHNLVVGCEAIDCFRWAFTTCHEKAGSAVYVNCKGSAVNWKPYGFIDIEGCDGGGSALIGCTGAYGSIAVSTSGTRLYRCEARNIHVYNADRVEVIGCTTHGEGLAVGGWSSAKNSAVRGGNGPLVIGNTVNKSGPISGVGNVSDWSFSVFSADGKGLVARNVLNEYEGPLGKGPGMKIVNVAAHDNQIHYRLPQAAVPGPAKPSPADGSVKAELRKRQLRAFASKAPEVAARQGFRGKVTNVTLADPEALFIKDLEGQGEKAEWFDPASRPDAEKLQTIRLGEHWDGQHGKYHGHAWYFTKFALDQDHRFIADQAHLLFGGVDSECRVFLNGKLVGEHHGWKDPFLFEVPKDLLKWEDQGANDLAIHVWTPAGLGGVYGHVAAILSQKEKPDPRVEAPATGTFVADFSADGEALRRFYRARRVSYSARNPTHPEARLQLRGGAYALTRESFGPGTYHVRFVLDESHPKFKYHSPNLAFFFQKAADADGKNDVAGAHEHLALTWRSGKLTFSYHPPATPAGEKAEVVQLGASQLPGPDSPARQEKDEPLDLTLVVPGPGGEMEVYLRKSQPEGKPDCTFKMPDRPRSGSFGFINHKWFSYVYLSRLGHSPLKAEQ